MQVTVTLYTQRAAFHAAQQQYKSFMFRIMLRPVLAQVSGGGDGAECSPAGRPLPPFLVTPRCVSIAQWARSAQGVTATTLVMAQVRAAPATRRPSHALPLCRAALAVSHAMVYACGHRLI